MYQRTSTKTIPSQEKQTHRTGDGDPTQEKEQGGLRDALKVTGGAGSQDREKQLVHNEAGQNKGNFRI